MDEPTSTLLDRALSAEDRTERREAFCELVRSDDWRQVLAPHVLSRQGYFVARTLYPDWQTFEEAAAYIAASEDKVQRCLELAGTRFSGELLLTLARRMGSEFVEQALPHLRTADGARATLLLYVLHEADHGWVKHERAAVVIRRLLKGSDLSRLSVMVWLGQEGHLGQFVDIIEEHPPTSVEEWAALGRAGVKSNNLYEWAMAVLPHHPGPILYLMRLEPVPGEVIQRTLAAARGDWVGAALELAAADGLNQRALIPLAEIAVRLGGKPLAAAGAWIGASKLSRELLVRLAEELEKYETGESSVREMLWIRRNAPSADRALQRGRQGEEPDVLDVAALVRQLRGDKVADLVREILEEPREAMIDPMLRLLCAVNTDAAEQVIFLCDSTNPDVAKRAREARQWTDVLWPDEERDIGKPLDLDG